jgi:1,4-alpha-glucan branching enzyme
MVKALLLTKCLVIYGRKSPTYGCFSHCCGARPGKKLLFMGGEFGQFSEWYCKVSLDWHLLKKNEFHSQLLEFVAVINNFYLKNPSLWELDFDYSGFQWLNSEDRNNSTLSFARFAKNSKDHVVCILNFTPETLYNYQVGLPSKNDYVEVLNSDNKIYGGNSSSEKKIFSAIAEPFAQADNHTHLTVPPLAGLVLKPVN